LGGLLPSRRGKRAPRFGPSGRPPRRSRCVAPGPAQPGKGSRTVGTGRENAVPTGTHTSVGGDEAVKKKHKMLGHREIVPQSIDAASNRRPKPGPNTIPSDAIRDESLREPHPRAGECSWSARAGAHSVDSGFGGPSKGAHRIRRIRTPNPNHEIEGAKPKGCTEQYARHSAAPPESAESAESVSPGPPWDARNPRRLCDGYATVLSAVERGGARCPPPFWRPEVVAPQGLTRWTEVDRGRAVERPRRFCRPSP
jgi:hypothetical protein